jgi:hypothetical protein
VADLSIASLYVYDRELDFQVAEHQLILDIEDDVMQDRVRTNESLTTLNSSSIIYVSGRGKAGRPPFGAKGRNGARGIQASGELCARGLPFWFNDEGGNNRP